MHFQSSEIFKSYRYSCISFKSFSNLFQQDAFTWNVTKIKKLTNHDNITMKFIWNNSHQVARSSFYSSIKPSHLKFPQCIGQYAVIIWKPTINLLETELPGESGGSSGTLSSSTDDMLLQGLPKITRD